MSKLLKLVFILTIALIVFSNYSYVFATVDMDLNNTNTSATNSSVVSSSYSSISSTSDFDLQLTNILSICLIVVGVLLILLGIAILIRLKR